jgi:hypothetical protein
MKHIATLSIFLLVGVGVFGQGPLVKMWDKRYGGYNLDRLFGLQKTDDGFIIIGITTTDTIDGDVSQPTLGPGFEDFWVIKIDSSGNKQWDKRYGGNSHDGIPSLVQSKDHGYLLGGQTWSTVSGNVSYPPVGMGTTKDFWIIKIDSVGNPIWDRRYGGSDEDYLFSMCAASDNGYTLCGYTFSDSSGDVSQPTRGYWDGWVIKIDSMGFKKWDKRFGGNLTDNLTLISQTLDKGYILGGETNSDISGEVSQPNHQSNFDFWIIKLDSAGNKQWDKRYGGDGYERLGFLQQTLDNGFILLGSTDSDISGDVSDSSRGGSDYWLVKVDSVGNKIWDKRFGGNFNDAGDGTVLQSDDGGYILGGSSASNISGDKTEVNMGVVQTWVIKTDALGNKQWDKTILTNSGWGDDERGFVIKGNDNCYLIGNSTIADIGGYKTESSRGSLDIFVAKFCDTTSLHSTGIENVSEEDVVSVFPNPLLVGSCWLLVGENFIGSTAEITDANGRLVFKSEIKNQKSEISFSASQGVYLLRISSQKSSVVRKLVRL